MRKKSIFILIIILCSLLVGVQALKAEDQSSSPATSLASEVIFITLDEAVERALNFNPDFIALWKNVDITRSDITKANTFTNPEASFGIIKGTKGDSDSKLEFELDKEMRLGSWWFNRKAAKSGYEAALEGQRLAEQALVFEVKAAFYSLLSLEKGLQLADETVNLNDELAKVARARFERGEVSEIEANIFEVERDGSIQEKKRIEADYFGETLRFKNLLGFLPEVEIKPEGKLFDQAFSFDIDKLIIFAMGRRPDLLEAQKKIEQAKAQAARAKVEAFPPVTLGFSYEQETNKEKFVGPRIGIEVPIFDQNRAQIQETTAIQKQAEVQFLALQIKARREIRTVHNNLKLLKDQIDIYLEKIEPKLEKTLEIYKGAYRGGQVGLFEILINQRQYFQAKGNYLNTLNEYDQAVGELERVVGGRLEEIMGNYVKENKSRQD